MGRAQTLNLVKSQQSNKGFGSGCECSSVQSRLHCRGLQTYRNSFMSGTKMPHFSQHYWENEPCEAPPHVLLWSLAYATKQSIKLFTQSSLFRYCAVLCTPAEKYNKRFGGCLSQQGLHYTALHQLWLLDLRHV